MTSETDRAADAGTHRLPTLDRAPAEPAPAGPPAIGVATPPPPTDLGPRRPRSAWSVLRPNLVFLALGVYAVLLGVADLVVDGTMEAVHAADDRMVEVVNDLRLVVERMALARAEHDAATDPGQRIALRAEVLAIDEQLAMVLPQFEMSCAAAAQLVSKASLDLKTDAGGGASPESPSATQPNHRLGEPVRLAMNRVEALRESMRLPEAAEDDGDVTAQPARGWQRHTVAAIASIVQAGQAIRHELDHEDGRLDLYDQLVTLGHISIVASIILVVARRLARMHSRHLESAAGRLASQLTEESATLESILASVPDLIFYKDTEGRYLGCNDAFACFAGQPRATVRGRTDYELFRADLASAFRADDFDVIMANETKHVEEWIDRPGGGQMLVETIKTPIRDRSGRVLGVVGISREITERKQYEMQLREERAKAEHASRAKSDFLASMSHELRTPLNGVIGMTEVLLNTSLDEQQERFVRIAKTSADALLRLINDVLDFSKIEAGKMELDDQDFDFGRRIEELAEVFASRAEAKQIGFVLDLSPEVPQRLCGDWARLQQMLTNLLGNALKFTSAGEVVLAVDLLRQTPTHRCIRLSVIDTGIGMSQDQLQRLFESFSQGDASTTRRFGGTGLGLVITKRIVELMGGTIHVESEPGQGSTFAIEVALKAVGGTEFAPPPPAWTQVCGLRTLLVASSSATRMAVARSLKICDLQFTSADTIEQAIALVHSAAALGRPFELLIHERPRPGAGNGDDPSAEGLIDVLQRDPTGRDLPILEIGGVLDCTPASMPGSARRVSLAHPVTPSRLLQGVVRLMVDRTRGLPLEDETSDVPAAEGERIEGRSGGINDAAAVDGIAASGESQAATAGGTANASASPTDAPRTVVLPPPAAPVGAERAARSCTAACADAVACNAHVRVLLAEDNEVGQLVAVNLLSQYGFTCDVATDGREAIEAACRRPYDLILMDCQMPEMDGFAATAEIRAAESRNEVPIPSHGRRYHRLPIVALTANAIQGDREACLHAGMDDYLTKPVDAARLQAMVHGAVYRGTFEEEAGVSLQPRWPDCQVLREGGAPCPKCLSLSDSNSTTEAATAPVLQESPLAAADAAHVASEGKATAIAAIEPNSSTAVGSHAPASHQLVPLTCSMPAASREEDPEDAMEIDVTKLMSACRGNAGLAARIVQRFAGTAPTDAVRMRGELANGDYVTLGRSAHTIKGAAACIAAEPVREAAAALERFVRARTEPEAVAAGTAGDDVADMSPEMWLERAGELLDALAREVDAAAAAAPEVVARIAA